jgi:peptide/nickel transport system permease protein
MVVWKRFWRHRSGRVGALLALIVLITAIVGPAWLGIDPLAQDLAQRLQPPSAWHWLGTDDLGRDVLARIVSGARISLGVGAASVGVSLALGVGIGLAAGTIGKQVDEGLMRLMDIWMAFPGMLLAILLVAIAGPGLESAVVAIALVNVPVYARLVRASVLTIMRQEFIEAARAVGASPVAIALGHVLPNCLGPIWVQATLGFATAVLETAALSFLGLGAQPPAPEWGAMLNQARPYIREAPWTVTYPGFALMVVVLGFNLLGDALRDLFDPRTRKA